MQAIDKIILGTAQFGMNYGVNNKEGKPTQSMIDEILLTAFESGIRVLDTAEVYGDAHDVLGCYNTKYLANRFNIITKLPHHFLPSEIDRKVSRYTEQLNVDSLFGLLFHSYASYQACCGRMSVFEKLKKKEKIRLLGVSVYTNEELYTVIEDPLVDLVQIPFNLFDNDNKRGEALRYAKLKGKIVHARSAFLQGLFFMSATSSHKVVNELSNEINAIKKISDRFGLPLHTIALNYCLQKEYIDGVLIGIDNVEQLQDNIISINMVLSTEVIAAIEKINIKDTKILNPSVW